MKKLLLILLLASCSKGEQLFNQPPTFPKPVKPPPLISRNVVYLEYSRSGLTQEKQDSVTAGVKAVYQTFDIRIVTDTINVRHDRLQLVSFQSDASWYSYTVGGTSTVGSMRMDNVWAFVFTANLKYSVDRCVYTTVHELGHTLSLLHQMQYGAECQYLGYTQDVWMGFVPNGHAGRWTVGTREGGCLEPLQEDSIQIVNYLKP